MKGTPYRRSQRNAGFSLLELLVAVSLLSVALFLLYSGLFSAAQSWETGERQIIRNDIQRTQLAFVRRLLREAVPLMLYDGRDNRILFHGERDTLRFIAPLPSHRGGDWAYLITIKAGPGGEGEDLLLYYERIHEDLDLEGKPAEDAPDVILLAGIADLTFSYYGDPSDTGRPDWHEEWTVADRLPKLVRLEVELAEDEAPLIPITASLRSRPLRGQLQQVLYQANTESNPGNESDAIPQIEE